MGRLLDLLTGAVMPILLPGVGLYFALTLGLFPLVHGGHIFRTVTARGDGGGADSPRGALFLALAGTLGVGNLSGVASAIALGGPGAVFWMWISALCALFLKYAETLLGQSCRQKKKNEWHGGAPYYIKEVLTEKVGVRAGKIAALLFCLFCLGNSLSMGCGIQVSAAAAALTGTLRVPPLATGLVLAALCTPLLLRGRSSVSFVTSLLVPAMTVGITLLSLLCLWQGRADLPGVVGMIIRDAFRVRSAAGGIGGFLSLRALRYGVMRGIVSNEAGSGTSPFAHAGEGGKSPVEQGFFGMAEVAVDTLILCTLTALVILLHDPTPEGDFMEITLSSYASFFPGAAGAVRVFLSFSVFLFAFATLLCWAGYGVECVGFLSDSPTPRRLYIFLFAVCTLLGSVAAPAFLWNAADLCISLMTLLNLPILLAGRKTIRKQTREYFATERQKKSDKFLKTS